MAKKKKISYASFLAELDEQQKEEEKKTESEKAKKPSDKPKTEESKQKKETTQKSKNKKTEEQTTTRKTKRKKRKPSSRKKSKSVKTQKVTPQKETQKAPKQKIVTRPEKEQVVYSDGDLTGNEETEDPTENIKGQVVCFRLNNEEFGVHISKIREIKNNIDITSIPELPDFIVGVSRLRNLLVPVMDLGVRFGFRKDFRTTDGAVIIVNLEDGSIGLIVDELTGTLDVNEDIVYDVPEMFDARESEYMMGIIRIDYRLVTLLNVAKLLKSREVEELSELQEI